MVSFNLINLVYLKGDARLPGREVMWADIREKREDMARKYVKSQRHTIQVQYVPFLSEIAELIGCNPNLSTLFVYTIYSLMLSQHSADIKNLYNALCVLTTKVDSGENVLPGNSCYRTTWSFKRGVY